MTTFDTTDRPRDENPVRPQSGGGYEVVEFDRLPPIPCPCGDARRAFTETADFPATIHVTEIRENARRHYHRRLTETYYVLECAEDACLELDEDRVPVRPGSCVLIRPGTRHRAVGRMKVLLVVFPKFDAADEWFDEPGQDSLAFNEPARSDDA